MSLLNVTLDYSIYFALLSPITLAVVMYLYCIIPVVIAQFPITVHFIHTSESCNLQCALHLFQLCLDTSAVTLERDYHKALANNIVQELLHRSKLKNQPTGEVTSHKQQRPSSSALPSTSNQVSRFIARTLFDCKII